MNNVKDPSLWLRSFDFCLLFLPKHLNYQRSQLLFVDLLLLLSFLHAMGEHHELTL